MVFSQFYVYCESLPVHFVSGVEQHSYYGGSMQDRPLIDLAAGEEENDSTDQEVLVASAEVNAIREQSAVEGAKPNRLYTSHLQSCPPGQLPDTEDGSLQINADIDKAREDSVSVQTFESVSDITTSSLQRPHTSSSMRNYAQFSDADTSSQTDLLQHSDADTQSQTSKKSGFS